MFCSCLDMNTPAPPRVAGHTAMDAAETYFNAMQPLPRSPSTAAAQHKQKVLSADTGAGLAGTTSNGGSSGGFGSSSFHPSVLTSGSGGAERRLSQVSASSATAPPSRNSIFDVSHVVTRPAIDMNDDDFALLKKGLFLSPDAPSPGSLGSSLSTTATPSQGLQVPGGNTSSYVSTHQQEVQQSSNNNGNHLNHNGGPGFEAHGAHENGLQLERQPSDTPLALAPPQEGVMTVPISLPPKFSHNRTLSQASSLHDGSSSIGAGVSGTASHHMGMGQGGGMGSAGASRPTSAMTSPYGSTVQSNPPYSPLINTAFLQAANTRSRRTFVELDDGGNPLGSPTEPTHGTSPPYPYMSSMETPSIISPQGILEGNTYPSFYSPNQPNDNHNNNMYNQNSSMDQQSPNQMDPSTIELHSSYPGINNLGTNKLQGSIRDGYLVIVDDDTTSTSEGDDDDDDMYEDTDEDSNGPNEGKAAKAHATTAEGNDSMDVEDTNTKLRNVDNGANEAPRQTASANNNNSTHKNALPKKGFATYLATKRNFLGEGQYARVFAGSFITKKGKLVPCAVKRMHRTKEAQVTGLCEVFILSLLRKYKTVVQLLDVVDESAGDKPEKIHEFLFGKDQSSVILLNKLTNFLTADISPQILIVLEFCPRGNMWDFCTNNKQFVTRALWFKWARQIAGAIRDIHSEGIVHHDIKPHNILLTENLDCKLADFGNACMVPESGFSYSTKGKLFDYVTQRVHTENGLYSLTERPEDILVSASLSNKYSPNVERLPVAAIVSEEEEHGSPYTQLKEITNNNNNINQNEKEDTLNRMDSSISQFSSKSSAHNQRVAGFPNMHIDTASSASSTTSADMGIDSGTKISHENDGAAENRNELASSTTGHRHTPISPGTPSSLNSQDIPHSVALGRGTQGFAAPELVSSDTGMYSFPVDVYSAGATLWSLMTLKLPFALGRNGVQLIQASKRGFFECGLQYGVPPGMDPIFVELKYGSGEPIQAPELQIVKRCVMLKPEHRCTANRLIELIDEVPQFKQGSIKPDALL